MYADRTKKGLSPAGATAALAVTAAMFAGLINMTPDFVATFVETTISAKHIPLPDPPPIPPKPQPKTEKVVETTPKTEIFVKPPIVDVKTIDTGPATTYDEPIKFDPIPAVGDGIGGTVTVDPPKSPPVMVDARPDPRAEFQPEYPPDMRRAESEGTVVVRVLIGTDGRVKQVEQVRSPSDSFFNATKRHALSRWRFKPATQDGVPIEKWKVMTLQFRLTDA